MAILGKLLKNRRAGETHLAWNLANLAGPETLHISSSAFGDGGVMPHEHASRRVRGGQDVSPPLSWGELPALTKEVLIFVEDVDVPIPKPAVHCVALVDPEVARSGLPAGALSARTSGNGVTLLRGMMGKGYKGPAPIKGHGPHRYVFQVFALTGQLPEAVEGTPLDTIPPRRALAAVPAGGVLARGRMTGTYER